MEEETPATQTTPTQLEMHSVTPVLAVALLVRLERLEAGAVAQSLSTTTTTTTQQMQMELLGPPLTMEADSTRTTNLHQVKTNLEPLMAFLITQEDEVEVAETTAIEAAVGEATEEALI